jgi:hypothetical protein
MPLIHAPADLPPEERLALYRDRGLTHAILLVPFDSLARLPQQAARLLAAEWGRELAELEDARRDLLHTPAEERARTLAGLWLMRLTESPIHVADALAWTDEAEQWTGAGDGDPRLTAFCEAWRAEAEARGTTPEPGPACRCHACKARWGKQRRRHP